MNKPKALLAYPVVKEIQDYLEEKTDLITLDFTKQNTYEEILKIIKDVEGAVFLGTRVDEELLSKGKNLKVISNITVGYNNFDIVAMKARGVAGTHSPGILDNTVADFVMGLLIASGRRLTELNSLVKSGNWTKVDNSNLFGKDISGSTVGIIGMGRIGEMVAKRCSLGFDMNVLYYNRSRKPEAEEALGVKYMEKDELLKNSDYIVLLTPLTEDTHHLLSDREFSLMKKDSIVVNASRGAVIDEKALIRALQEGRIAGAGLDVYEKEPMELDNPLLKMDNVITSPHISAGTQKTMNDLAWNAAKSMVSFLVDKTPINIIPEMKGDF